MSNTFYDMEALVPGADMTDNASLVAALTASLNAPEPNDSAFGNPISANDAIYLFDTLPADAFTLSHPQLTEHVPGETATHHNVNNGGAPVPQFDPRALLNPTSGTPKRPASSGGETDRSRIEPSNTGQVSLVERLHNVQERTSSPAKRLKAGELHPSPPSRANFAAGSALGLQYQHNSPAATSPPQQKPAIDLTMSKYRAL